MKIYKCQESNKGKFLVYDLVGRGSPIPLGMAKNSIQKSPGPDIHEPTSLDILGYDTSSISRHFMFQIWGIGQCHVAATTMVAEVVTMTDRTSRIHARIFIGAGFIVRKV
jgi:hypothetical protein